MCKFNFLTPFIKDAFWVFFFFCSSVVLGTFQLIFELGEIYNPIFYVPAVGYSDYDGTIVSLKKSSWPAMVLVFLVVRMFIPQALWEICNDLPVFSRCKPPTVTFY